MTRRAPLDVDELLRHAQWVRRLALGIVADAAAADDVVQETFVAAIERPPRADVPLGPWLARVARNIALKVRRSGRRRSRREAVAARDDAATPADSLARAEAYRAVVEAVVSLDPPYREVVLLRWFDGLEAVEIAARLEIPLETARTRLKRAHGMLRARLSADHGDRSAVLTLVLAGRRSPGGRPRRVPRIGAGTAATAGGALVIKKLVAAAVILALLAGGYVVATTSTDGPLAPPQSDARSPRGETAAAPRAIRSDTVPDVAATTNATPAPRVRGRVLDAHGAPVAGATVVAVPASVGIVTTTEGKATSTTSAADGSFDLAVSDVAPTFRLFADAPRRSPAASEQVRPGEDVTLVLAACSSLAGRVRNMSGEPISGARIRWIATLDADAAVVRGATTDKDGAYRIDGLPPSRGRLHVASSRQEDLAVVAEAPDYARLVVHTPRGGGFPSTLDLWMVRGATVNGVVVDGETNAAIVGARVVCAELGSRFAPAALEGLVVGASRHAVAGETTTDAEGRFQFDHVQAEGVFRLDQNPGGRGGPVVGHVLAAADGYAPGMDDVPVVADGTRVAARIKLWPATRIEGRVVDSDGAPVVGVRVSGFAADLGAGPCWIDLRGFPSGRPVTDADGRYRFDAFPARRGEPTSIRLSARSPGETDHVGENSSSVAARARAGETTTAPDLVLGAAGGDNAAVFVRVVDPIGRPVWGATASLHPWRVESTTDRCGRLRFAFTYERAGIPPRPQQLVIRARGWAPATTPEFTPSKAAPPEITVTLGAPHRVSGRCRRADGSPVADAAITVTNGSLSREAISEVARTELNGVAAPVGTPLVGYGRVRTRADGTFTVEDLPDGPCWVSASIADASASTGPASTDATDVLVVLRDAPAAAAAAPTPGATLDATVVDAATHVPLTNASITLRADDGGEFATEAPWEERGFTLHRWTGLHDGAWRIDASAAGYLATRQVVSVRCGSADAVEVGLSRGTTVRGTLTTPAGFNAWDAYVGLVSVDDANVRGGAAVRPDADGRFAISGVPPGRWRAIVLRANSPLSVVCTAGDFEVEVAEGSPRDLALDVRAVLGGSLGVAFLRDGKYVTAVVRAEVRDDRGRVVATMSPDAAIGGASFELPAGSYVVAVTPSRGIEQTQRATVVQGAHATAKFELP
jgi:RNA polymerase sigma factor (sigma-70 family)